MQQLMECWLGRHFFAGKFTVLPLQIKFYLFVRAIFIVPKAAGAAIFSLKQILFLRYALLSGQHVCYDSWSI